MRTINRTLLCISIVALFAVASFISWNSSHLSGTPVAGRYHLDNRTTNFFERAKTPSVKKEVAPVKPVDRTKTQKTIDKKQDNSDRVTTRYHQMNRTTSFFQRAIG